MGRVEGAGLAAGDVPSCVPGCAVAAGWTGGSGRLRRCLDAGEEPCPGLGPAPVLWKMQGDFPGAGGDPCRDENQLLTQGAHLGAGEASSGEDASGPAEVVGDGRGMEPCCVGVECPFEGI